MSKTSIEWTRGPNGEQGYTFNPWVGCTKISPACDHCYAESWAKRAGSPELWNGERRRTRPANWAEPLKWDREAAAAGERRRVFCASLADVFDNQVPAEWRADLFRLIRQTPNLDWLLLTKRIGNATAMIDRALTDAHLRTSREPFWPWPNVWLGSTVVTQEEADRDIPKLLAVPARVRFLSIEPLLSPIDLRGLFHHCPTHFAGGFCVQDCGDWRRIDWVIAGSESGSRARPCDLNWIRALRDQCVSTRTAFFWKQHVELGVKISTPELDGRQWVEHPRHTASGRDSLGRFCPPEDGREHNETPRSPQ